MIHFKQILIPVLALVALLCATCKKGASDAGAGKADTAALSEPQAYVDAAGKLVIPERASMAVSDFAGVLGDSVRGLEDDLRRYAAETPAQIIVVTMADLGSVDPQQIAAEILHRWGVGENGKDNGVVILLQPSDGNSACKAAIVAGKGLEPMLSAKTCQGIADATMQPKLAENDYYGAVSAAVNDILRTISATQQ